jgi:chromosome partitioning protein
MSHFFHYGSFIHILINSNLHSLKKGGKMKIISIANQKGGCGKTTTAINLSACLAFKGRQVLLIDMDPQGHSTMGLNIKTGETEKTVYDALCGNEGEKVGLGDVAVQVTEGFDFVPANIHLSTFEQQLSMAPGRENKLREIIEELHQNYDYVLIDCPPSLGLLTFNSLMASKEVFIPIDMGFFSLHGTKKLLEVIDLVRDKTGHEIRIKALATMYDRRTRIAKEILEEIRDHFKGATFKTVINFNVKLKEAASYGKSILDYDKKSRGYRDYLELADDVIAEEGLFKHVQPLESRMPATRPPQVEKRFIFHAPDAKSVKIVGSFNNWIPTNDYLMEQKEDGTWSKNITLPPGEYQYKFVVDGVRWVEDKNNSNVAINPFGARNSVLVVS